MFSWAVNMLNILHFSVKYLLYSSSYNYPCIEYTWYIHVPIFNTHMATGLFYVEHWIFLWTSYSPTTLHLPIANTSIHIYMSTTSIWFKILWYTCNYTHQIFSVVRPVVQLQHSTNVIQQYGMHVQNKLVMSHDMLIIWQ